MANIFRPRFHAFVVPTNCSRSTDFYHECSLSILIVTPLRFRCSSFHFPPRHARRSISPRSIFKRRFHPRNWRRKLVPECLECTANNSEVQAQSAAHSPERHVQRYFYRALSMPRVRVGLKGKGNARQSVTTKRRGTRD